MVLFKCDFSCLQAINLTNSTTGDLVFPGGKKFYPVNAESSRWNTLLDIWSKISQIYWKSKLKTWPHWICNLFTSWLVSIVGVYKFTHTKAVIIVWHILRFGHWQILLDKIQQIHPFGHSYITSLLCPCCPIIGVCKLTHTAAVIIVWRILRFGHS